jgi:hypothetical protein
MTARADFTEEEWDTVLEAPTSAGMIVATAQRGGSFREAFAMAKVYAEARQQHGESELLDEIVAHRPEMARARSGSPEQFREQGLERIRAAIALIQAKASEGELGDYRLFVTTVAKRVAEAKHERGAEGSVTDAESTAIADVESAVSA